ncbi:MAG: SH3 domain-containing protein [Sarcina sp.]
MRKNRIVSAVLTGIAATTMGGIATSATNNVILLAKNQTNNFKLACVINKTGDLTIKDNNGKVIGYASEGEMLEVKSAGKTQSLVTVKETGITGYINNENILYIEPGNLNDSKPINQQGEVTNVTTGLYLRQEPNVNSKILATVKNGTKLKLSAKVGDWYKASVDGTQGYLFGNYVDQLKTLNSQTQTNIIDNVKFITGKTSFDIVEPYNYSFVDNNGKVSLAKSNNKDFKPFSYDMIGAKAISISNGKALPIKFSGNVDISKPGVYKIGMTVSNDNKNVTDNVDIHILDKPPVIVAEGASVNASLNELAPSTFVKGAYSQEGDILDNNDIQVNGNNFLNGINIANPGQKKVNLTVKDKYGTIGTKTVIIDVQGGLKPIITGNDIDLPVGAPFNVSQLNINVQNGIITGYQFVDNNTNAAIGSNSSGLLSNSNNVTLNTNVQGFYTLKVSAVNMQNGNTASKDFVVSVI